VELQVVNGERGARRGVAPGFAVVAVHVEGALCGAVDAAAARERVSRRTYARRVIIEAIENDDGEGNASPYFGKRGPNRPHGLGTDREIATEIERSMRDRLDAIAKRKGISRTMFVERALMAAVAALGHANAGDAAA